MFSDLPQVIYKSSSMIIETNVISDALLASNLSADLHIAIITSWTASSRSD